MGERAPRADRRASTIAGTVFLVAAGVPLLASLLPGVPRPVRLVLAAAALTCAVAGLAWRSVVTARERTERFHRRLTLVSRAALELQRLRSVEDVHDALATLLVHLLPCRSARVLVVEGDDLWLAAAAGETPPLAGGGAGAGGAGAGTGRGRGEAAATATRALRERRLVHEEGASADAARSGRGAAGAPGAARTSTVAIPLSPEDRPLAVLELRRDGASPFDACDREAIEVVVRLAEEALVRLSATEALRQRQRQAEGLARMSERLLLASDETSACHAALRHVLEAPGVTSAAVLRIEGDRLAPVARAGEESPPARALLGAGVPFREGPLVRAWREGRTLRAEDAASAPSSAEDGALAILAPHGAVVPVSDARGSTRALLAVARDGAGGAAPAVVHDTLGSVAVALGATLERLQLERRLQELLDVVRALAQSDDPVELYAKAVDAAVRLIPGAEAATIMVRHRDGFHFAAGHGYDMTDLRALGAFAYDDQVAWYGLGRDAFIRGVPRVVRGDDVARLSLAAATAEQSEVLREHGRIDQLRATITVPITARRQVLGLLNVDNLSLEDAFDDHELDLAEAFGQHVGAIIRQVQTREALTRAAVTDALTGLGNREGFNRRLEQDLARARRRGEGVHLVMMDLDGFKRINDELGHDSGDEALVQVARALEEGLRLEDGLFRWGGDEFALILTGVDAEAAAQAAERHAEAVSRVRIGGLPMSLSVGIASYPRDGGDAPALLRRADDLMYRHKHRRDDAAGRRR